MKYFLIAFVSFVAAVILFAAGPDQVLLVCEDDDWAANKDTIQAGLQAAFKNTNALAIVKNTKVNWWLTNNHSRIFYVACLSNGGTSGDTSFSSDFAIKITQSKCDNWNALLTGQCEVSLHSNGTAAAYLRGLGLAPEGEGE